LLAELGWSPNQLAGAINGLLGPGCVARSTVSDWLNQDRLPREPMPTVVAHLFSDVLDREVSVAQLWSGRTQPAEFWVPADHGLQLPWTAAGSEDLRNRMVDHIDAADHLRSASVERALRTVPRHLFVPDASIEDATPTSPSPPSPAAPAAGPPAAPPCPPWWR
jgi:hypothetical protein